MQATLRQNNIFSTDVISGLSSNVEDGDNLGNEHLSKSLFQPSCLSVLASVPRFVVPGVSSDRCYNYFDRKDDKAKFSLLTLLFKE